MWCCKYHVVKCAYGVWIAARRGDSISLFPQIGFLPDILWASNHSIKNVDQSFTFSPKFSLKSCDFRLFHFWRLPQYLNMPVRYGSFIFQVLDNVVYEKNIWICQSCCHACNSSQVSSHNRTCYRVFFHNIGMTLAFSFVLPRKKHLSSRIDAFCSYAFKFDYVWLSVCLITTLTLYHRYIR